MAKLNKKTGDMDDDGTLKGKTIEVKPTGAVAVVEKSLTKLELIVANLTIADQITYDKASEYLLLAKKGQQDAVDALDPQRASAWETYQIALTQLNKYKNPFVLAEKQIKEKMGQYLIEQEEAREAREAELQEAAEALAQKERDKLAKRAEKAALAGKVDKAEELLEQAEAVVAYAPQLVSSVAQTEGVASRFTEKPEVIDRMKLIKAIADGTLKIDLDKFISFSMPVLEKYINLTGIKNIPGIQIKKTPIISASKGGK